MPNEPEGFNESVEDFITRWQSAEAAERANYPMFLTELRDLLELPHPDSAGKDNEFNRYVFDRPIKRNKKRILEIDQILERLRNLGNCGICILIRVHSA